jgi:hypothetical protein
MPAEKAYRYALFCACCQQGFALRCKETLANGLPAAFYGIR